MKFHFGRLIDHVHLVVSDLEKSRGFYRQVLASIGRTLTTESPHSFASDELYVSEVEAGGHVTRTHLAFQAKDRQTVDSFHLAGLKAGGTDNGRPGERKYHPGYYAAFILDPDGNNIEAVFHGEGSRSAESIEIVPKA